MKPTKENFEQWNEELAEKHDLDKFYNHPNFAFRYIEQKRISKLIELAEIKSTDKVLEVGCGAGHILEQIKMGELYGIDISDIQIQRAMKRLGSKVKLSKAPGEKIPFEDKFFDKILCSEVVEHVLDPREVLKEMSRVLKDDGILSLSIPNEDVINSTKKFLKKTGLIKLIDNKKDTEGWELAAKDNLDEWHLHSFSLALAEKFSSGIFKTTGISKIPNAVFPARYVIQYKKI
ncbi:MAG: methyltransferase domain-containing protein [Ignavibacteria bacterium]|nr:methyltransferase domain-containing protein [Ignavibacteria bacterium]MBK6876510.1 methyltransferase domain-containing protein [Ignavibacteria bacterium]MBK9227743.1 methyltransferase domain-containing protein [Ignavibacteria bacterium]